MNLFKLTTKEDFLALMGNEALLVVWNDEAEIWDKDMQGKKIYEILEIKRGTSTSKYPDEIILRKKGNIFFNWMNHLENDNHVVKEVYLLVEDSYQQ